MIGPEIEVIFKKQKQFENGRLIFEEYNFRAVQVFQRKERKTDHFGIAGSNCFILAPGDVTPEPGDRICISQNEFEIRQTQNCVDLAGKLRGIRCMTDQV